MGYTTDFTGIFKLNKRLTVEDKQELVDFADDTKPFIHGQEGTHYACAEMTSKLGAKVGCCGCNKHNCKDNWIDEIKLVSCTTCEYFGESCGNHSEQDLNMIKPPNDII